VSGISQSLLTDLNVHFDDSFADERRAEERTERYQEVTTRDAGEVKQRVGNL